MKSLVTVLITLLLFSVDLSGQHNFMKDTKEKLVPSTIEQADELSSKISPLLNNLISRIQKNSTMESASVLKDLIYFYTDDSGIPIIPVLIKSADVSSTLSYLKYNGGTNITVAGDIISVELPAVFLRAAASSPDIIYIEGSSIALPKTNVSRGEVNVTQIHNGSGLPRPYKGSGVVSGVIDSGIDWKHADFKNTSGNRILYLWDMSTTGNPPSGYNYGTEYLKSQLDANQCLEKDLDDGGGHGTHVAATSAGSGGANASYMGMAPESNIIFVKGFRSGPGFASTDVINGCSYIFSKAQQLGKPAVINLSLGGHYGPHDGTSLYEQGLSNLTGNGKIIVAAAGNEGGDAIHLSYASTGSSFDQAYETFFELENGNSFIAANMWYNSGNIFTGLAAYDRYTLSLIGYTNGVGPGQKLDDIPFIVNSVNYGWVTIDATAINNPNNGAKEVIIAIDSHNGQIDINSVYWTLFTYGSGTFDAWIITGGEFSTYTQDYYKGGDVNKTVGMPGTAEKLICIGSYVTKNQWVDIDGITQYQPGNPSTGNISYFSSLGPSRDGRLKPDLVAPGEAIIAALSSDLQQVPRPHILLGGKHQKMQGTSMAAPHVAGVVALLLEKNNTLNYDQTVTILKNTTKKDGITGSSPNNTFGHGKLNALNAFNNTPGSGSGVQTANLVYDDGTPTSGYYWNQAGQGSVSRMTPTLSNATLNKMEIYFTGVNAGTATYKPIVVGNSGGSPGNDLIVLANKTASSVPGWDATDLSSYNISVNGDFYVGLKYDGINKPSYGYDPVNNGRAWDYGGSSWTSWNETYFMRATIQTVTSVAEISSEIPEGFELGQNYPNPFNPTSTFKLSLPEGRYTRVIVYDIRGSKVAELVNNFLEAGIYQIIWNGRNDQGLNVSSGTYIYTLQAGDVFQTKKMILIR
jgi:minor extracellular serine protease Vpr